jgi:hypothetical protein
MTKDYPMSIQDIRFHPAKFRNGHLLEELGKLDGSTYKFVCSGASNSYQLKSTLDLAIQQTMISKGATRFTFQPACSVRIDSDFALSIGREKVVFEVEKANREKLLYDFLKMHIYLRSGATAAVLIAPTNWAHSSGVQDHFDLAQKRFDLCKEFGMMDRTQSENMMIMGVTQYYEGKPLDSKLLRSMKEACEVFFRANASK